MGEIAYGEILILIRYKREARYRRELRGGGERAVYTGYERGFILIVCAMSCS